MTEIDTGQPPAPSETPVRLRRSGEDKVIAGICGGLGRYFNTDPMWFRLAFVLFTIAGGAGILIYLIGWIVIPEAKPGEAVSGSPAGLGENGPIIAGIALVGVGLMLLINTYVPWFDRVMWPLAIIAAGAGLLFLGGRRERK